jgi:hypothetical protein
MIVSKKDFDLAKFNKPKLPTNNRFKDLTNKRFGKLQVVAYSGRSGKKSIWLCKCDCGNWSTSVPTWTLVSKTTTSCGCGSKEPLKLRVTHNKSKTRAYNIWSGMLQRCNNPKASKYENYGGRGIKVCDRWYKFENFHLDMGNPLETQTLDRIDSDKDYSPDNCRWATYAEQNRNTKHNNNITIDGRTQCLTDWCKEYGIKITTVLGRIDRNWNIKDALETPVRKSARVYA